MDYSAKNIAKYYSAIKSNDTCDNINEPWKHTKWKKQNTKACIVRVRLYEMSKIGKSNL